MSRFNGDAIARHLRAIFRAKRNIRNALTAKGINLDNVDVGGLANKIHPNVPVRARPQAPEPIPEPIAREYTFTINGQAPNVMRGSGTFDEVNSTFTGNLWSEEHGKDSATVNYWCGSDGSCAWQYAHTYITGYDHYWNVYVENLPVTLYHAVEPEPEPSNSQITVLVNNWVNANPAWHLYGVEPGSTGTVIFTFLVVPTNEDRTLTFDKDLPDWSMPIFTYGVGLDMGEFKDTSFILPANVSSFKLTVEADRLNREYVFRARFRLPGVPYDEVPRADIDESKPVWRDGSIGRSNDPNELFDDYLANKQSWALNNDYGTGYGTIFTPTELKIGWQSDVFGDPKYTGDPNYAVGLYSITRVDINSPTTPVTVTEWRVYLSTETAQNPDYTPSAS